MKKIRQYMNRLANISRGIGKRDTKTLEEEIKTMQEEMGKLIVNERMKQLEKKLKKLSKQSMMA